jgi:hypothetical protein
MPVVLTFPFVFIAFLAPAVTMKKVHAHAYQQNYQKERIAYQPLQF